MPAPWHAPRTLVPLRRPAAFAIRVRRAVWHHTGILGTVRHCQAVYGGLTVRMRIDARSMHLYSVPSARQKNPDDRGGREWRRVGGGLAVPKSSRKLWGP